MARFDQGGVSRPLSPIHREVPRTGTSGSVATQYPCSSYGVVIERSLQVQRIVAVRIHRARLNGERERSGGVSVEIPAEAESARLGRIRSEARSRCRETQVRARDRTSTILVKVGSKRKYRVAAHVREIRCPVTVHILAIVVVRRRPTPRQQYGSPE